MRSEFLKLQLESIEKGLRDNGKTIAPAFVQRQMDILRVNFPEVSEDLVSLKKKYNDLNYGISRPKGVRTGEKIDVGRLGEDYNPLKKSKRIEKNEPVPNSSDQDEKIKKALEAKDHEELLAAFDNDADAIRMFINEKTGKSISTMKIMSLWKYWTENIEVISK